MAALTWSAALALSQPEMDSTHREFVDLLAALERSLDGEGAAVSASLAAFIDHTEAHFAQEDRWMTALGFAPQNCHAFQHAGVLKVLRDVQLQTAASDDRALLRQLVAELAIWFPAHAQAMDGALAQVMAERGFDVLTGTCAATAPAREEATQECGSASCS